MVCLLPAHRGNCTNFCLYEIPKSSQLGIWRALTIAYAIQNHRGSELYHNSEFEILENISETGSVMSPGDGVKDV
jgi:hypothetical protein